MTIRWITPLLGTAPAIELLNSDADIHIVDVRDLVDKAGNRTHVIEEKIKIGQKLLSEGKKTVVCCDYGISRSNAIAAGILAVVENISLEAAVRRVQQATNVGEIKVELLHAVRAALGTHVAPSSRPARHAVMVTGGNGFLGKAIVATLASNMHVTAPSRHELDVSRGSTQIDVIAGETDSRTIVHLASPRVQTSNVAMGSSITMLRNIIDVCIARNISLVYLSGWEIYSGYRGSVLADESLPPLPRGPYGETKFLCETLIEHSCKHLGLRCALVRSGPIYGLGGDRPKFIYNFLDKAQRNETIVTHHYRNGDPALDLLHVNDLVNLITDVVRTNFTGTINAGTGILTSTHAIASMLILLTGSTSRIERIDIDADTARIAMDTSRARSLFGWNHKVSFTEGLASLLVK
ncbi:NAD-dependent epimerase/dehydratase family protein [Rhodanobacter sp. PCA2]|uniref:NAD-dependent epimerase/dehydratase family protein n=1 Tax=Rhodanobacter sp. PCA2 TaxID=2006117 RepID=UPI0015E7C89A|nr:NAD-dependent epimerase/dehydratase family protein [Rhodanobacter sp. PCA2]MBA2077889.1 hypothetical protein [Rhodanobacter sp. PCA2]